MGAVLQLPQLLWASSIAAVPSGTQVWDGVEIFSESIQPQRDRIQFV